MAGRHLLEPLSPDEIAATVGFCRRITFATWSVSDSGVFSLARSRVRLPDASGLYGMKPMFAWRQTGKHLALLPAVDQVQVIRYKATPAMLVRNM